MAQTKASSPQIIYDTLVGDTAFMSEVGEYTFDSGATAPSISIVTPGADLPPVKSQVGMEVVIHDIADLERRVYLTDSSDPRYNWKVFLIVWSPANGATVTAAQSRILELFPLATSIQTVASGSVLGVDFQTQVTIPSDCPVTA